MVVDPMRNRIVGSEGETALQPKMIDLLCALAARPGEVLSREQLIDQVWGREHGADESLTRAISQLRKALGDTRGEPKVIETISKRGYRLILHPVPADLPPAAPTARRRPARLRVALAAVAAMVVLAFALSFSAGLFSGEPPPIRAERTGIVVTVEPFRSNDSAIAVGGLADELSADLARSPLVRARSAGAPRPEGQGLLRYRLRGDVHRAGDRLRISAQLLDETAGEVVWGASYDRPYDRDFSNRSSLVGAISRDSLLPLLRAAKQRLARRPATSLLPWEATLLVTWVPGDEFVPAGPPTEDSFWLQRHALAADPDYAPAHALYAELAAYHALFHPPSDNPQARLRARRHADRALELAPYDAEILYQLALYHRFSGERARAAALLERVLDLQPNHPLARIELDFVQGQCATESDQAVARLEALVRGLAPSSPARWVALSHLSSIYLGRGELDKARDAALASRRIIRMPWTAMTLAAAEAAAGRNAEAARILGEHRREWPDMDLHHFARHVAARWCLNGPRSPEAGRHFLRLADALEPARK